MAVGTALAASPVVVGSVAGLGGSLIGVAAPSVSGFLGSGTAAVLMNPITIGVAAGAALFFIADAIIGEVPQDEYILPPWRFMNDSTIIS